MIILELKQIAEQIWFLGMKESEILKHWDYRKGKNVADINSAMKKAWENGLGKSEYEVKMFEIYLKSVLKKKVIKEQ